MTAGDLAELFSGIQGEGLFVGERQIFVRLAGCNLNCRYCDTAWAREPSPTWRAERHPGARDFADHANPVALETAAMHMLRLHAPRRLHRAVSFTGGEPLLQAEFVGDLARAARRAGLKAHLETNGTPAAALTRIADALDVIAMDLKLPSAAGVECWDEHRAFLEAAEPFLRRRGTVLFAKAVFAQTTSDDEIARACALLRAADPRLPLVLQPISPLPAGPPPPTPARVLEVQALAARHLRNVRVIPQVHKLMGQM